MNAVKNLSIRLQAVGGDKVRQEFKSLGTDGQKAFRQITRVITPANDNLKALSDTAKIFNGVLKQAAGLVGAYAGLRGLTSAFKNIFNINNEFESLSGSLKTVTGSAEGAQKAFAIIEKFALDTPYQLEEIVEAFIRLKALGLEPSMEALTSYGNTASAFGKNIMDFTEALSNAVMFNFRSLRSFGILATTEGDKVKFTFQGVITEVAKNSKAIEQYLRRIGDVNFGGAMLEQMNTIGGVLSNIEDAFGKAARTIGATGLNAVITDALKQFNDLIDNSETAAETIGTVLTAAVKLAGKAFFTLAENLDLVVTLLTARLGSSAVLGAVNLLRAGVGYLQVSFAGLSAQTKSAVAGIAMMSRVSKLAAAQMAATALTVGALKGALAEWGLKLKTAEQNIKDLRQELKNTGGLSLTTRLTPNSLLKDYDVYAKDWAETLRQSKIDLERYEQEIWKLAAEYPDFQPQAKSVQDKLLLLNAAEKDAWKARNELKYLQNPELRPKDEIKTQTTVEPTVTIDADKYKKNIEDIKQKILELKTPYEQAMAKADEWRANALKNLNASSADYDEYKQKIEQVYADMVKKADKTALDSSKSLADGFKRGFVNLQNEVGDFASLSESAVKNAFSNMENTLVSFVTTGKASFADFANAIMADMARIAIRQAITQPLMTGIGAYFGFGAAHTGGVVGKESLMTRSVSPLVFASAPKFHGGGIVGDEIPIIAKRGEGVFTREQMKALGSSGGANVNISVNVVNKASNEVKTSITKSNQGNGKFSLDIMIEKIENSISKNVSKGTGLAPVLERRYGLNPAFGSYG